MEISIFLGSLCRKHVSEEKERDIFKLSQFKHQCATCRKICSVNWVSKI